MHNLIRKNKGYRRFNNIETGLDWDIIIKELRHQFSKNPNSSQLKISIQNRIENLFEHVGEIKGLTKILQICGLDDD